MKEFGLQFLHALIRLLTARDIAHEPRKHPITTRARLADRQFHGEGGSVLAQPDHDAAGFFQQ